MYSRNEEVPNTYIPNKTLRGEAEIEHKHASNEQ